MIENNHLLVDGHIINCSNDIDWFFKKFKYFGGEVDCTSGDEFVVIHFKHDCHKDIENEIIDLFNSLKTVGKINGAITYGRIYHEPRTLMLGTDSTHGNIHIGQGLIFAFKSVERWVEKRLHIVNGHN
jgi:hypothetical protein